MHANVHQHTVWLTISITSGPELVINYVSKHHPEITLGAIYNKTVISKDKLVVGPTN